MENQNDSEVDKSLTVQPSQTDSDVVELQRLVNQCRQSLGVPKEVPVVPRASDIPRALTADELAEKERIEAVEKRRQLALERCHRWESLVGSRGYRYSTCSLETFDAATEEQSTVVSILREYCGAIGAAVKDGRGVLLYGPRGTGKDHLAMAICREAIKADFKVKWQNGMDLFGDVRDMMDEGDTSERSFVERMIRPDILYLSDPLPPIGALTQFQAAMLFRILDGRYSRSKPLIVTVNVSGRNELDDRIGPQNCDRILDGALAVFCNWESYRKVVKR